MVFAITFNFSMKSLILPTYPNAGVSGKEADSAVIVFATFSLTAGGGSAIHIKEYTVCFKWRAV